MKLHDPPRDVHPQWYEAPTFYFSNPHSVVGAHDDVPVPPGCSVFDYELEVAAVIGRDGRDLDPASAGGAHRGVRDLQRLVCARSPVRRDAGRAGPGEG